MARKPDRKGYAAASMQQVSLRQVLAILGAGMVILIIVPVLLDIAIQQGAVAPPQLDVRLRGLHLIAYTIHAPDCDGHFGTNSCHNDNCKTNQNEPSASLLHRQ